jgi:hypothetical protein
VTDQVTELLHDAEAYARRDQDFNAVISLIGAVRELQREHGSTAHLAATVDPGLLGRVTELERLVGVLVKSVGVLAASPQPRAAGQSPLPATPDCGDRPATYGPVPAPYGRPSPAHAVDCVARALDYELKTDGTEGVEYAGVEYVRGEPTLQVQVSGVLYRFHAPNVLTSKEGM